MPVERECESLPADFTVGIGHARACPAYGPSQCVHGLCDADATTVDSHGDPLCARHDQHRNGG